MRYPVILAAALATGLAAPALAAPEVTTSTAVKYSDLDLATQAGQDQLERRIDSAARAACGLDSVRTDSRVASASARRCYEQTRTNVHKQVAELIARNRSRG